MGGGDVQLVCPHTVLRIRPQGGRLLAYRAAGKPHVKEFDSPVDPSLRGLNGDQPLTP